MIGQSTVLAAEFPPSVEDFYLPSIVPWGAENSYWFTKITALVWIAAAAIISRSSAANLATTPRSKPHGRGQAMARRNGATSTRCVDQGPAPPSIGWREKACISRMRW